MLSHVGYSNPDKRNYSILDYSNLIYHTIGYSNLDLSGYSTLNRSNFKYRHLSSNKLNQVQSHVSYSNPVYSNLGYSIPQTHLFCIVHHPLFI